MTAAMLKPRKAAISVGLNYKYAEQGATGKSTSAEYLQKYRFPIFQKSIYYAFGNNSNVFIRYVMSQTGLPKFELQGSHPPNRSAPQDELWFNDYRNPN